YRFAGRAENRCGLRGRVCRLRGVRRSCVPSGASSRREIASRHRKYVSQYERMRKSMSGVNVSLLGMGVIAVSGFLLLILVMYFIPVRLWIAAWSSGAYVGLSTLVGMRLRRVPPSTIVTAR